MALVSMLSAILKRPTLWDVVMELMIFVVPLWIAVAVGVVVGWAWRPKWINLSREFSCDSDSPSSSSSVSNGIFKLPMPSVSFNNPIITILKLLPWYGLHKLDHRHPTSSETLEEESHSSARGSNCSLFVNEADFRHLWKLVETKDGGPAWIQIMDRSTPTMTYQAWRRDPQTGPPQYRSRTVFEDATPEMVRDFFWDDEFRSKWDDMLIHHQTLQECQTTGAMLVQWVRKFPFFCSDREYVIGRRIWEAARSYYCVTKGVPCSFVPRHNKPRRVDLYHSSWCIRAAVESQKGNGRLTACEVLLFHHEDMGIPWEIAKLGVRQGMWGAVKKIDPGLRAYQKERASGAPMSHCALIAQSYTSIGTEYLRSLESDVSESQIEADSSVKPTGVNIPKLLLVGGAIALACSLDQGLWTKVFIFEVARRFANIGRKL
ncbi:hypothetical protein Ancab_016011 [Ancistrocladus abbreviatus]